MPHCMGCKDTGWVCEAHPNKPWSGPSACLCGAPGMPCHTCCPDVSEEKPPDVSRVFTGIARAGEKRLRVLK